MGRSLLAAFPYAPGYRPLNHGSFGSCPRSVLAAQQHWRDRIEAHPDETLRFIVPPEMDRVRQHVADVVHCRRQDVVLVQNATTATNAVLRSLAFKPGDKILYFSTSYGALEKTVLYLCNSTPAQPLRVDITYPTTTDAILTHTEAALGQGGVKIAVIDTVSSMPSLRLPYAQLVALCRRYDCLSLIDGAHGVGCIPLNLQRLAPDFFTSNLHKWYLCARPAAFLYVAAQHQKMVRALPTSHGYGAPGGANPLPAYPAHSPFETEFGFVGTMDFSSFLSVPAAADFRASLGGDEAIFQYIHDLSAHGGARAAAILGTEVLRGTEPEGAPMVNVRLPLPHPGDPDVRLALERALWRDYQTFIPLCAHAGAWWARLSAQVYLDGDDFDTAGHALREVCARCCVLPPV